MKNFDIKISFFIMGLLIILAGIFQSWGVALSILNLCLISAVMSMGVNIQWGFAGLINFCVISDIFKNRWELICESPFLRKMLKFIFNFIFYEKKNRSTSKFI